MYLLKKLGRLAWYTFLAFLVVNVGLTLMPSYVLVNSRVQSSWLDYDILYAVDEAHPAPAGQRIRQARICTYWGGAMSVHPIDINVDKRCDLFWEKPDRYQVIRW